jgi:hypothetical protein
MELQVLKSMEFTDQLSNYQIPKHDSPPWNQWLIFFHFSAHYKAITDAEPTLCIVEGRSVEPYEQ